MNGKKPLLRTFRARLFAAVLAVTAVCLLVSSAALLQVVRVRMTQDAAEDAREDLDSVLSALDGLAEGLDAARAALEADPLLLSALAGEAVRETKAYAALFSATEGVRAYARFDLYDSEGVRRYSTEASGGSPSLSPGWGVLRSAETPGAFAFTAADDPADTARPLLRGAAPLYWEGRRVGTLVTGVYHAHLRSLLEGKYGGRNDLLLLSALWRPVYCVQPSLAASLGPQLRRQVLDGAPLSDPSGEFSYQTAACPALGVYAVLRRPEVFTHDTMRLLYTISLAFALFGLAASVFLSFQLSGRLSRPVRRLTAGMDAVEAGDLTVRVEARGDDELASLTERFNEMVAALAKSQEALVENQRELNEAQIRMLQAQLNPHFLCNTLDTMKWISRINRVPQVAEMSADLADILRYAISPDELVPLRRELAVLERYMDIQKVRLSGRFVFGLDVPEELEDALVPKLMLQPLVENAVLHGLEGVDRGEIFVSVRADGGTLTARVRDSGRGFPEGFTGPYARLAAAGRRDRLGLYNVDTILKKYYGEGYGLVLENDGGAVVTAALPLRREEEGGEEPCGRS